MKKKVFKSLDEQIEILKEKGLTINDIDTAKEILLRENYFFISGYRHLLMNKSDRTFINGSTFEELHAIFKFDRDIRNLFFKNILIIENNIKSIISYNLSKKYGLREKEYLNPKNFTKNIIKTRQVADILNKIKRQIRINGRKHTATTHYLSNYDYIPLWILVKVLSFGIVAEFYNIFLDDDKMSVASYYDVDKEELGIYLSILSNMRNLCAHEEVLYDHKTQKEIENTKYHRNLEIEKYDGFYIYGKNDLFAVVIILKQLLSKNEFIDFLNELEYDISKLEGQLKSVELESILNKIGFPNNWSQLKEEE